MSCFKSSNPRLFVQNSHFLCKIDFLCKAGFINEQGHRLAAA